MEKVKELLEAEIEKLKSTDPKYLEGLYFYSLLDTLEYVQGVIEYDKLPTIRFVEGKNQVVNNDIPF